MCLGFLDSSGALIPYSYEVWKDDKQRDSKLATSHNYLLERFLIGHCPSAGTPTRVTRMSPTMSGSQDGGPSGPVYDNQFIVVASEKQCRVMTLPSQNCIYKQQITDTDYVIKAEIINLKGELSVRSQIIYSSELVVALAGTRHNMAAKWNASCCATELPMGVVDCAAESSYYS